MMNDLAMTELLESIVLADSDTLVDDVTTESHYDRPKAIVSQSLSMPLSDLFEEATKRESDILEYTSAFVANVSVEDGRLYIDLAYVGVRPAGQVVAESAGSQANEI